MSTPTDPTTPEPEGTGPQPAAPAAGEAAPPSGEATPAAAEAAGQPAVPSSEAEAAPAVAPTVAPAVAPFTAPGAAAPQQPAPAAEAPFAPPVPPASTPVPPTAGADQTAAYAPVPPAAPAPGAPAGETGTYPPGAPANQTGTYPPGAPANQTGAYPPGAPAPYTPAPTGPGVPPPPGAPRRGLRPWVWWVIGGSAAFLVLVVVGVIAIVSLILGGNGAKNVAQDYVSAIAKGDASAANKLARVTRGDESALLTDAVLRKAVRITAPSVTRTVTSGQSDLTLASVTYKLAGKSYRATIELDRDDKGWYVARGLTYSLPYVMSNDTGYRLAGSDAVITTSSDLSAYPGVYTMEAPNRFYTIKGTTKVTVAADASSLKGVQISPSQAYLDEVQKQVDAHYDECAAKTGYYDIEDCGIQLSYPDDISTSKATVKVTIVDYPKVTISDDDSYYDFNIDGGSFTATISGTNYSGAAATEKLTGEAGYISADIKVDDDKVVVTFN